LPELRPADPPPRNALVSAVATRLQRVVPGYRRVADDLLADGSRIDLFGVADGQAVIALVGGPGDDLILVARALAQREWLAPRLADWRKLAPNLGLRADARVRALVVCPEFGAEARAAARAIGAGIGLVTWRTLRNGSDADLLLEPIAAAPPPGAADGTTGSERREPERPSAFRSGLSESDLGLTAAERAEFE
jgi:hypothetical protein